MRDVDRLAPDRARAVEVPDIGQPPALKAEFVPPDLLQGFGEPEVEDMRHGHVPFPTLRAREVGGLALPEHNRRVSAVAEGAMAPRRDGVGLGGLGPLRVEWLALNAVEGPERVARAADEGAKALPGADHPAGPAAFLAPFFNRITIALVVRDMPAIDDATGVNRDGKDVRRDRAHVRDARPLLDGPGRGRRSAGERHDQRRSSHASAPLRA